MEILLQNASFAYPNGFLANENLNLKIEQGERVAIIGQNGAGKTTAVKMMNGLHKPVKGDVLVAGKNTKDYTTAQIAREVGYVFQNPDDQIFNQDVRREIAYMPRYYKLPEKEVEERVRECAELVQIEKYLDCNPFEIPYVIRKFVTIAAILAIEPKFIILDEPTAGQDLKGILVLKNLLTLLEQKGVGVVTITHDMEFAAENFSRIIVMANKHIIAEGNAKEIFSRDEVIRESKVCRTKVGEIADDLGLGKDILFTGDFIERLREKREYKENEIRGYNEKG